MTSQKNETLTGQACETCAENDFYESGGFFFCQECNTQSQALRVIENESQFDITFLQKSVYQKVDQHVREMEKEEQDMGIPWTTHDAFGLLLQAQGKELVQLGAPLTLPALLAKLWERYQNRKLGTPNPRARDTTKDRTKGTPPVAFWRALREKRGKWPKSIDPSHMTKEERKDWAKQNEQEEEEDEVEEEEEKKTVDADTQENLLIAPRTTFQHVQRMRMEFSLCFLYLTLLHLESHISLGDLLRWSKECLIPYLNPSAFFPVDMKFSVYDVRTFSNVSVIPSSAAVLLDSGRLSRFLQLNPFPPVDIRQLVARLVVDLNLPNQFVQVCSRLLAVLKVESPVYFPASRQSLSLPNYEALAVFVVVAALKIVFRLDDVTEFVASHLTVELEQKDALLSQKKKNSPPKGSWYLMPPTLPPPLFRFNDWFQFAGEVLAKMKTRTFPTSEEIRRNPHETSKDVAYLSRYYSQNLVNRKGSIHRKDLNSDRAVDALQASIRNVLLPDVDVDAPLNSIDVATSFPVLAAAAHVAEDARAEAERKDHSAESRDQKGPIKSFLRTRFDKSHLGIFFSPREQRELVKDELLLSRLNLPSYDINAETGIAVSDWSACESIASQKKIDSNKKTLKNLFSHQSKYCLIAERQRTKERKRETQTRSAERKDAIFKFSNSIGLLVELCSEVIGQDVKGLLRDLIKIEQDYVVQNEVDLLNFDL